MYNNLMNNGTLSEILARLRDGLEIILRNQLDDVYLFGSQARSDADPDSDIDVIVIIRGEFDYDQLLDSTIDLVAGLSLEYDVVISRTFVTRDRFHNEINPFLMNVRREAVQL